MDKKITIMELAKECNVSIATISRFINGTGPVKTATRNIILDKMKELNYPIPEAYPVKNYWPKEKLIMINIPSVSNTFYNEILLGAKNAASRLGYYSLVNVEHLNVSNKHSFFELLRNINPAGIIILNALPQDYFDELCTGKYTHFVQCCEYTENQDCISYVSIDDYQATRSVMNYIFSTNHKKVAILCGPSRYKYARHRMKGYKDALNDAGLLLNLDWIIQLPEINFDLAFSSINKILSASDRPDAIYCTSDVYAAAAIRGAASAGLRVPEDVIITGFDNIDISRTTSPSITTMSQPKYQLGFLACELLTDKIRHPNAPAQQILLDTELIIRESTGHQ